MTSDKATASLAEVKKALEHPMLVPHKARLSEMVRQLESLAANPTMANMNAINWQNIMAIVLQIIQFIQQIVTPPSPSPTPTPPATGGKKG